MKKFLFLILIVLLTIPAFSQVKFGIKAGVSTTTVPTYSDPSNTITALKNASFGIHGGIFVRLSLLGIYLQPEVLLATNTYEYTIVNVPNPVKQTFNKLDIPILIGFKLGPVRINAGPAATVQIGTPKALIVAPNFGSLYKSTTFGYQAGAGFDLFKKLTFDVRYEGSLSGRFGDSVTIGGSTFKLDSRQPSVLFSVGWMF